MSIVEKVRENINKELALWDQPSIAVGIVKDGKVVLNEGFGYADVEKQMQSNADTMYQIGSCSKAFTAAAAALLVDQGKLEWDKPVHEYMPWLEFQDPYTTLNVTVRDLLCHRTGLPRHDAYWINGPCTRREMAENLRNMQPVWSFRSHWCYQNTCFVAAGLLIEELSGMTWEEFVQENILKPLGMDRTTFYVDAIKADPNHATPYSRLLPTDLTGYEAIDFLKSDCEDMSKGIGAPYGPAGSIMSTINDMCKWVQFNLDNGKVDGKQIISEANMKEVHKANMLMSEPLLLPFPEEDFYSYGMGWFVETYRGHVMVEHGGNIDGFSALVTMIPDMQLGIVCLTNFNNSFNTYASTNDILDLYMGAQGGDWHNRWRKIIGDLFASEPEKMKLMNGEQIPNTTPSHDLADYAGVYHNACYGDIVITYKDNSLYFLYNKEESPLMHFHYDTFQIHNPKALFANMNLRFEADRSGKIHALEFGIVLNPEAKDEIFVKKAEV